MEPDESLPQGADLIFLSEFPIGVLADRPPEVKSVQFELKETGRRKPKQWGIHASESWGLPNYVDMQVFIICLAYTKEQGFPEQVHFCRHRLIQDLGWSRGQENYDRIQLALNRMVGTTYTAINHYPNPKGRECVQRIAFHLMDRYEIHDSREATAEELPPSWFRWGDDVQRLLHTRQLKTLDLSVFRTLKRPVSQAMYRYLHTRHLDGKATFEENLVEYACERLGLSRDFRWASDLKRTLNEGHRELIEKGLIASAGYERMRAEKGGRPQQKVVIQYPPAALPETLPSGTVDGDSEAPGARPAPAVDPLVLRLVEVGMTPRVAQKLVTADRAAVEEQLAYWPHREKIARPAAALRRAIEEQWAAPEGFQQAQAKAARAERAKLKRQESQAARQQTADNRAAFDAWWASLPEAERDPLTAAARAELIGDNPTLNTYYQRCPDRLFEALRPLLQGVRYPRLKAGGLRLTRFQSRTERPGADAIGRLTAALPAEQCPSDGDW